MGPGAALERGRSLIDPADGRVIMRLPVGGFAWARRGNLVLSATASAGAPLTLTDTRDDRTWLLPYPSRIGGQGGADQAVAAAPGNVVAVDFGDPAYYLSATQVTDAWLLNLNTRRFTHLPDMPAVVSLKSTSMAWTPGGQLVWLGQTGPSSVSATLEQTRDVVAVWRPGQRRIAVRIVHIPERLGDSFVIW